MIHDLEKLAGLIEREAFLGEIARAHFHQSVDYKSKNYPIFHFSLGSQAKEVPVLFLVGGVHGIERIGAQLAWSLLKTTIDRMIWDKSLRELLNKMRLVVIPLINPVGYYNFSRSNGNSVDLMRNSPVVAVDKTPFLLGGHRISNRLPWYQGELGKLERENQILIEIFEKETMHSSCVIAVDFHSGFGLKDRLWFPFSYTLRPFDHLPQMHALTQLFEQTHPYHIYQIEPQSKGYLLNGDIWDHLYLMHQKQNSNGIFLPLTLEMGSWNWVKKNPLQLFSKQGAFNPIKEHRIKRTYRRHHLLFEFLLKASYSNEVWSSLTTGTLNKHMNMGIERWYS